MHDKPKAGKLIIIFGAGKIGRSFIGQLFSGSGYEVVFIDNDKELITELNRRREYNVIIKSNNSEGTIQVRNVRGLHTSDKKQIIKNITNASILAISVGLQNLPAITPILADSLETRHRLLPTHPIDIIIAENMKNGAEYIYNELSKTLNASFPLDKYVGLVETSIGKMVPIMAMDEGQKDILQIFAEPYNTLIVDKKGFKNKLPDVANLSAKDNIKAWVDRKLYIHNLGHAAAAYIGYLYNQNYTYIYEALAVPQVKSFVLKTMLESAAILVKMYPGDFTAESLEEHINNLICRFENRNLKDTIHRVGRDLFRKLGADDRLAGIIKAGYNRNLPTGSILFTLVCLVCATFFQAKDEQGRIYEKDILFDIYFNNGIEYILTEVCGFSPVFYRGIHQKALGFFQDIKESPKNILNYI